MVKKIKKNARRQSTTRIPNKPAPKLKNKSVIILRRFKKIIIKKELKVVTAILLAISIQVGLYLISPIWRVVQVNDPIPEITKSVTKPNNFDPQSQALLDEEIDKMKTQVIEISDSMPARSGIIAQGALVTKAHLVKGNALLVADGKKLYLRFENFETINGPDLHIYLSSNLDAKDFIDLGKIRGTKGNINYVVPQSVNLDLYDKVLIWCVPFGVLFSYAVLD